MRTVDQCEHRMNQLIRTGFVVAQDANKHRVRVELRDTVTNQLVSQFLPVLIPRASSDLHYDLPDIGDQVLCLFGGNGLEQGYVVGSMYGKQKPPVGDANKVHRKFKDGSTIEYDRESHKLTANINGDIDIHATGQINIKADGEIIINGQNVRIN